MLTKEFQELRSKLELAAEEFFQLSEQMGCRIASIRFDSCDFVFSNLKAYLYGRSRVAADRPAVADSSWGHDAKGGWDMSGLPDFPFRSPNLKEIPFGQNPCGEIPLPLETKEFKFPLKPVGPITEMLLNCKTQQEVRPCTCPTSLLMTSGCKCGGK